MIVHGYLATSPPVLDEPHSKGVAKPAETSASTGLFSLRVYRVTDGGLNCWKGSRNLLKALWLYCGEGFSWWSPYHATLTSIAMPFPMRRSSFLDMVENWHRGLINGRQMNSRLPLLLPFFPGLPVSESINARRPSVIKRTSSTDCSANENQPVDVSAGNSITIG